MPDDEARDAVEVFIKQHAKKAAKPKARARA
jgi:hypothetical protein